MDEFLKSKGWFKASACGCTPQKFTWKNENHKDKSFKVCPSRGTWELLEYDKYIIGRGQSMSLATQYETFFK